MSPQGARDPSPGNSPFARFGGDDGDSGSLDSNGPTASRQDNNTMDPGQAASPPGNLLQLKTAAPTQRTRVVNVFDTAPMFRGGSSPNDQQVVINYNDHSHHGGPLVASKPEKPTPKPWFGCFRPIVIQPDDAPQVSTTRRLHALPWPLLYWQQPFSDATAAACNVSPGLCP